MKVSSTCRILINGDSGTGKTYLISKILEKLPSQFIFLFTPYQDELSQIQNRMVSNDDLKVKEGIGKLLSHGNVIIVIDDSDLFLNKQLDSREVKELLISSRHRNVGWILLTRRLADMPILALKQATQIISFQTNLDNDLRRIKEMYSQEYAERIKALDRSKHEFLLIDRNTGTAQKMIAV